MTTTTERFSVTNAFIHKCSTCKGARRVEWTHSWDQRGSERCAHQWTAEAVTKVQHVGFEFGRSKAPIIRCTCGGTMGGKFIVASISEHKCDARCMNSRGHVCDCSCGGANHGKAFTLELA